MNTKLLLAVTIVLLGLQSSVVGQKSKKIYIRVVDEKGEPVQGAEVDAMYLQIIKQDGKEYRLPQVLAKAETNRVGRVDLVLPSMEWKFAGLHARIREMTTDEMIDKYDDAPTDKEEFAAFERDLEDRAKRYSAASMSLEPDAKYGKIIVLKLEKAVNISGRIRLDGKPHNQGDLLFYSKDTRSYRYHPGWAGVDGEGKFNGYFRPSELKSALVSIRRPGEHLGLVLEDIELKPTKAGRFVFDVDAKSTDFVPMSKIGRDKY